MLFHCLPTDGVTPTYGWGGRTYGWGGLVSIHSKSLIYKPLTLVGHSALLVRHPPLVSASSYCSLKVPPHQEVKKIFDNTDLQAFKAAYPAP
jgi:hypothetical protein